MKEDRYDRLMTFLQRLSEAKIHYRLSHNRDDAVSVEVTIPGERWEVDFLDDGCVDVERFVSNGVIQDESALEELFAKNSDPVPVNEDGIPARE